MNTKTRRIRLYRLVLIGAASILALSFSSCIYMKMDPPPDVDKAFLNNNNTCYLATAANMLAAAGYGSGNTVQDRADEIYGEMVAHFGTAPRGWTDVALDWWLSSTNNTWSNNPYQDVSIDGHKSPRFPWAEQEGARQIGDSLRDCNFIGLSISWPTNAPNEIGSGGHAITCWGDHSGDAPLTTNPSRIRVTNSDRDTGGDVQRYTYDSYTNPNPGGPNEGNGWYFDYDPNHPYIKHIIILEPITGPSGNQITQKVVGSYRIHQADSLDAIDLHYKVGTDTDILSYRTKVSWSTENPPTIVESEPQRRALTVDWDFSDNPVPRCKWVTITTEFVLRFWNSIWYEDVYFTYPDTLAPFPRLGWVMRTPTIEEATAIPNVTGGYIIGSFDVIDPSLPSEERRIVEYRLVHEYSFNQDPEDHVFILTGGPEYAVTNLRFGHSYGFLRPEALWEFKDWMTEMADRQFSLEDSVMVNLDWEGRLPYPEGEDIKGRIPELKHGLDIDYR